MIRQDHGAPIDSAVTAEHESCPATTTTTTTTTTTITTITTTPTVPAGIAAPAGDPADAARRNKEEMSRRHLALRKSWLGEGGTLPAKDENDRGSNAGQRVVGAEGDPGGA